MYLNAFDNGLIPREELLSLNLPTVVCSAVEVNHYTKSPAMVTNIHLPIVVEPIEALNSIDLPIVVEPIEALNNIDLPIVVEPIEAQNENQ